MKKRPLHKLALLLLFCLCFLSACNESAPRTTLPQLQNQMPGGVLSFSHTLEKKIFLSSRFSTSYDTKHWRVTDSKTINVQLVETQDSAEATIFVEHVHIDVSLKSTLAMLDGWTQDSADFKLSTGSDPGVLLSPRYPYTNVMAIEGFSQTLIDSWTYYTDSYAVTDADQKRLTENNLVNEGQVYANKVQVVWFLLLQYPGESHYHSGVIVDEFLIPVAHAQS